MTALRTKPDTGTAHTHRFTEGDRVKLWNRKDAGTVDEVWFDGPNEIVAVVWDISGCVGDCRAYQLAFASEGRQP